MFQHQRPEKRSREDDDENELADGSSGFTEHRKKRIHSLPFRTSPPQKRWLGPPNFPANPQMPISMTPSDSESEGSQECRQPNSLIDVERDTDMMVDDNSLPQHLEPGPSRPDTIESSVTGRLPTPIHCTFAAQVRGSSWGATNHARPMIPVDRAALSQSQPFPTRADPSVPRSLEDAPAWSMVQNRRLPSPISENGGEDMPTSPDMMLDTCSPAPTQPQRPYLPHMPHSTNPHAMALHPNIQVPASVPESDEAMMDTDAASPSSAPATPSPRGKFGHSRSKHTLNNWTLQPGMKKSFSIGYRADCEKCRQKIPGHFNHIIIS